VRRRPPPPRRSVLVQGFAEKPAAGGDKNHIHQERGGAKGKLQPEGRDEFIRPRMASHAMRCDGDKNESEDWRYYPLADFHDPPAPSARKPKGDARLGVRRIHGCGGNQKIKADEAIDRSKDASQSQDGQKWRIATREPADQSAEGDVRRHEEGKERVSGQDRGGPKRALADSRWPNNMNR